MISEDFTKTKEIVHTVYDKYGNETKIVRYDYPTSEEFIAIVNPDDYEECTDMLGLRTIKLHFDNKTESLWLPTESDLFGCQYFDTYNKCSVYNCDVQENYYMDKPSEIEVLNTKLKEANSKLDDLYIRLQEEIIDGIDTLDFKLFDYSNGNPYMDSDSKFNELVLKISNDDLPMIKQHFLDLFGIMQSHNQHIIGKEEG